MPIRDIISSKCPLYGLPGQARFHISVVGDIGIVVITDEVVMNNPVVGNEHDGDQDQTWQQDSKAARERTLRKGLGLRRFENLRRGSRRT